MDIFKEDKLIMKNPNRNYSVWAIPIGGGEPIRVRTPEELPFDKDHLKRFDAGLAGFAGYEFNMGFFVTAGFQKGLYNIDNFEDDNKLRNNTFTLSVGYKF